MGYIKKLYIDGLKRFEHFEIEFNERLSILVGENEAGKSTILEAIRIVLNQQYWNADKSVLQDLFNLENIKSFQDSPSVASLPKILIEIDLQLDNTPRSIDFYGPNHEYGNRSEEKYGIRFECKFDEDFSDELADSINDGVNSKKRKENLRDTRSYTIAVKQEFLLQVGVFNIDIYNDLFSIRQARNKLIHEGVMIPESKATLLYDSIMKLLNVISL